MAQSLYFVLVGIVASIFVGVISNWIYYLLRDRGLLPDRPTRTVVVLISIIGFALIFFTTLQENSLEPIARFFTQYLSTPVWAIISALVLSTSIGVLLGSWRAYGLMKALEEKQKELDELGKNFEQYVKLTQDASADHIINPE